MYIICSIHSQILWRNLIGNAPFGRMGSVAGLAFVFCFTSLCAVHIPVTTASLIRIAVLQKAPYTTLTNHSPEDGRGILRDVLQTKLHPCGEVFPFHVKYENDILRNLDSGQAEMGGPVVARGMDPSTYGTHLFLPVVNYQGADFLTKARPKVFANVVTKAVLDSWPLLALTVVMTAIAGIITWALVSFWSRYTTISTAGYPPKDYT